MIRRRVSLILPIRKARKTGMKKFDYKIQVDKDIYNYRGKVDSFYNLSHQLSDLFYLINKFRIKIPKILIIRTGANLLKIILNEKYGFGAQSLDIDPCLKPDYVGSVDDLGTVLKQKYDIIVCAHVLEHLPFDYFNKSLNQIKRFSNYSLIYLPKAQLQFFTEIGILPLWKKRFKISLPLFFKKHKLDGEHYWEIGTKGYAVTIIMNFIKGHFYILKDYNSPYWLYSYNFILKSKKN